MMLVVVVVAMPLMIDIPFGSKLVLAAVSFELDYSSYGDAFKANVY